MTDNPYPSLTQWSLQLQPWMTLDFTAWVILKQHWFRRDFTSFPPIACSFSYMPWFHHHPPNYLSQDWNHCPSFLLTPALTQHISHQTLWAPSLASLVIRLPYHHHCHSIRSAPPSLLLQWGLKCLAAASPVCSSYKCQNIAKMHIVFFPGIKAINSSPWFTD